MKIKIGNLLDLEISDEILVIIVFFAITACVIISATTGNILAR
jgi:hypothetical protein